MGNRKRKRESSNVAALVPARAADAFTTRGADNEESTLQRARQSERLLEQETSKVHIISMLEKRIEDKDKRIEDKDNMIELLKHQTKTVEAFADKLITEKENHVRRVECELSLLRAKYEAEVNLRPLLEFLVRQWYSEQNRSMSPNFTTTKAFQKFARKMGEKIYENVYLKHVVEKMACDPIKAKPGQSKKEVLVNLISELYGTLSEDVHNISGEANIPPDIIGFVVNRNKQFSSVVSAILIYFNVPHTVMAKNYRRKLYDWGKRPRTA